MRNIFIRFKRYKRLKEESERLLEENKILKAQNEALIQFKTNFDNYYHSISNPRIIESERCNIVTLNGAFDFIDLNDYHYPIERCKEDIVHKMCRQLEPYIEFDMVDNQAYGTKSLVGKLSIVKK